MNNQYPLQKVREINSDALKSEQKSLKSSRTEELIAEMFSVGNFYYYILNISDHTLSNHHDNILKMHGLNKYPVHLKEVISLIHPDDLEFVIETEKLEETGRDHPTQLKSSHCFRMKTGTGNYEMFHHQSLPTLKNEEGQILQTVNIHTNIQHLIKEDAYSVWGSGMNHRKDFQQESTKQKILTKRELEILNFITKGHSASAISKILNISFYTVRTHRKNILEKTHSKNISELMKVCFQRGLI